MTSKETTVPEPLESAASALLKAMPTAEVAPSSSERLAAPGGDQDSSGRFQVGMDSLLDALGEMKGGSDPGQSSHARLREIKNVREVKRFDGAVTSLMDALEDVPTERCSLLDDNTAGAGAAATPTVDQFGRGLSVFDHFNSKQDAKRAEEGALGSNFGLQVRGLKPGSLRAGSTAASNSTMGARGKSLGSSYLIKRGAAKGNKPISRNARKRKEKAMERGMAYADRKSGPARRTRGKGGRIQVL